VVPIGTMTERLGSEPSRPMGYGQFVC